MATWKKADSAWFGDTFNRDATLCYAVEADSARDDNYTTATSVTASVAKGINSHCDGEISFTGTVNNMACFDSLANKANNYCVSFDDISISSSVASLKDSLQEIQERINALESKQDNAPKVACARLRPLLKTLNYEREVQ